MTGVIWQAEYKMCEKADKNGRMRKMCEKLRYIAEIQMQ